MEQTSEAVPLSLLKKREQKQSKMVGFGLEGLPTSLINEIMAKLDTETLCSMACVSRALRSAVSEALSLSFSLDLSGFSPDAQTLDRLVSRCKGLKALTLDCLCLDDSFITICLGPQIQELNLLKCSLLSYQFLASVGESFPNLRLLTLELSDSGLPEVFNRSLEQMLRDCPYLESLCLKIRGVDFDATFFQFIEVFLPKTVKILKLQPVLEKDAIRFIHELRVKRTTSETAEFSIPLFSVSAGFTLQSLSLVLDIISDELVSTITSSLPLLIKLHLEDRPMKEPSQFHDLTNSGLQSLRFCCHLTDISLVRGRQNLPVFFKRINDMGMFLLSEGCALLESVRLGGFCKVSDAGFASILHSCQYLKKFEVHNGSLLSDLALHDLTGAPCSLVEVKLSSCSLITSETVEKMASSRRLEVLDLFGCRSIADPALSSVARLNKLTTLNLGGADVTDRGLSVLSGGCSPIAHLCLRGCKRVTDKGISLLLRGCGAISKTLTVLDLGHMPGISDIAILTIAAVGIGITELCIRYCFYVTDSSVEALSRKRRLWDGSKPIRRLDLFHCTGLSVKSLESFKRPSFEALKWIGVGGTCLSSKGNHAVLTGICSGRPWVTLCFYGCEMGCHDGWHYQHTP